MPNKFKKMLMNTRSKFNDIKEKVHTIKTNKEESPIFDIKKPKEIKNDTEKVIIEFSLTSVVKATLLVLLLIGLSDLISDISKIIVLFFIALLLSSIFDPTVDYLQKKGVPRPLGVISIYLLALLIIGAFLSTLVPLVVKQLSELAGRIGIMIYNVTNNGISDIPLYEKFKPYIDPYLNDIFSGENQQLIINSLQSALKNIATRLSGIAGNLFSTLTVVFNGILNLILVLVLTFFMSVEEKNIQNFIKSLFPSKYAHYIVAKSQAVKTKTGHWLRGQITLSLIMGSLTFIGMSILGIDFALTLGLFSTVAEFMPIIGPTLTAIAAVLIALNQESWQVIAVIIFFALQQFAEGNLIIPLVMREAVGLNPVAIITAALIAYQFLGIPGLILAIPTATVLSIFVKDFTESQK